MSSPPKTTFDLPKHASTESVSSFPMDKKPLLDLYEDGEVDAAYQAKARLLNQAIQEIGMGRYQWYLFVVCGFGWFADSVWPMLTGLILSPVLREYKFDAPFLSLASNIGLLLGAIVFGFGSDIWGRRWSFNITLFIAGVFGTAAGGAPNFIALASLVAVLGVGVGGNMPTDSAVFLDFIPSTHQYLLTVLSVWWSIGQFVASLVAWPLIANFTCAPDAPVCNRADNMGWRYLMFTLGGLTLLMWSLRFFVFTLLESPRYLAGLGKDQAALEVIHKIAKFNGRESSLTLEHLAAAGAVGGGSVLSESSVFTLGHVRALFATRKMAFSTSLLILLWGIIGLASTLYNSFLPYLLASKGAQFGDGSLNTTYRNQVILSILGIPAAFLAGWAVDLPRIGRRGTLTISSALTGVFLFASTTARSSNALLGWNCGYVFFSNIMYGVLYAVSPEIFPASHRGTGNGLTSTATRVFGIMAPVIALYAEIGTAVPVYVSGGMLIVAGGMALLLPYEPMGRASI